MILKKEYDKMNDRPLVSIAIPTYNRPSSLSKTLDSVVNQTYSNLEIIVSDNCSPDEEVAKVMAQFALEERIRYYRQPVNKGAIFNYNFILEKVTGQYFMRLGDDDWIDPNYVESCLSFLTENPDYICAYGRTKLFNLNGDFRHFDPDLKIDQSSYFDRMIYYYENVTQNGVYFSIIDSRYMKSMIIKKKLADDWVNIARVAFEGKIKMLDNTHLNLTLGGTGSSTENTVKALGLSKFNKYYPYFSIGLNVSSDILWRSPAYKKLTFSERFSLSKACFKVIYRRFAVYKEIKKYKPYLKALMFGNR